MYAQNTIGAQISGQGLDLAAARAGLGGARLEQNAGLGLFLAAVAGPGIAVGGDYIPASTTPQLLATDNLIDATGADAGAAMAASTLYYIYLSSAAATFSPSRLRGSLTAPTRVGGIYALGAAGNAANWLLVGWARTTAGIGFQDDPTYRGVVSYYNRQRRSLFVCPQYVDDDAQTTYGLTSAVWALIDAAAQVSCIYNGEDAIELSAHVTKSAGAIAAQFGIGRTVTDPDVAAAFPSALTNATITAALQYGGTADPRLGTTPQFVTFAFLGFTTAVLVTLVADQARNGAAADPPGTWLAGSVAC